MKSPPDPSNKRFKILIIEDDYANRFFFAEYLKYCGFEILALADGLNLELHLQSFQPHLLLLDIGLPEIDGYALLKQVRKSEDWSHLPVIVVSGYAFDEDQRKAFSLGAQQYFVKPVRPRELLSGVRDLLHG